MKCFNSDTKEMSKCFHTKAIQRAKQANTMAEKVKAMELAKHYRMWVLLSR